MAPQHSPFWFARMWRASADGLGWCKAHADIKLVQEPMERIIWNIQNRKLKLDRELNLEIQCIRTVKPKAFATLNGLPYWDPVFVYQLYAQKRPGLMQQPDVSFYLGMNHMQSSVASSNNKFWFKSSAMGINKLNSLMKSMAKKTGLKSQRLTNHSGRKRMIKKLNDMDVPPTHIMQIIIRTQKHSEYK